MTARRPCASGPADARRKGAAALTVALCFASMGALMAVVVDLGLARLLREQLQAGTDAAALGAVRRFDNTASSLPTARATATHIAGANTAFSQPVQVRQNGSNAEDGDVVTGVWDSGAGQFTAGTDPKKVNAVLVRTRREGFATWFANLFGRSELAAATISIATEGRQVGAGRVPWYLPFSLPKCEIDSHTSEQLMDMTFVLNPAGADVTGFGSVEGKPSASWTHYQIDAILPCMHEWYDTGTVTQTCTLIEAGDDVYLGNGEQAGALNYLSNAMGRGIPWSTERWGALPAQHENSSVATGIYGTVLEGPIPIFTGGSDYCTSAAKWNEVLPVAGFVWGAIYDVASKGTAAERNVWVRLDVSHIYEIGEWSGGNNYGITWTSAPVLVW